MSTSQPMATGFVRVVSLAAGPRYYAQIRTADGRRLQRALGPVWTKRSRPPAGYLTRADAERRLAAILAGEDAAVGIAPRTGVTFAQAAAEWLRYVEHDRRRERSTVLGYQQIVSYRLLPVFGELALDEIDLQRAEQWRVSLLADGLRPTSINKLRWTAAAIVKRAMRVWPVTVNAFEAVERQPSRQAADFTIYSPTEIMAIAMHALNEQDAVFFQVAAFTGLRLGELRALRWGDLDFTDRLVHVRRAWVRGRLKVPKSGKVRSVPMIDQVVVALHGLSRREHFTDAEDLVFVDDVGGVIDDDRLRRRFHKVLGAAELKRGRLHDLRHSYCSLAVRAYRLDEVRVYAGHADISTTMLYVHHVPANDAAERLSAVVTAATSHPVSHRTADFGRNSGDLTEPETPVLTGDRLSLALS